jgi:hypothetical protein
MPEPERIYIAGPYCPKDCSLHDAARIAQHNTDKAIEIANALIEKGHFVFVPHLSHYIHVHYSCKKDYGYFWYEEDNTFLKTWATALFYISPSKGADMELELAKELGFKIYYSLDEVPYVENKIENDPTDERVKVVIKK